MWSTDWSASRRHSGAAAVFQVKGVSGRGDGEKEIDLRGFEDGLTGLDDGWEWWGQGALCQWWWVEPELPVGYANADVQGSLGNDTL